MEKEIRIIIAGGRDYQDYQTLKTNVDNVIVSLKEKYKNQFNRICIVCGDARGADTLGDRYGQQNGLHVYHFPANWKLFGKQAGPVRNAQMARFSRENDNIGVLIAFWDGASRGTKSMIELAKEKKLNEVFVVRY